MRRASNPKDVLAGALLAIGALLSVQGAAAQSCPPGVAGGPVGFRTGPLDAVRAAAADGALPTDVRLAYDRVLEEAEAALKRGPYAVTDKPKAGPSGDKRDYLSLAPYWWPDPTKPDGLPYVQRDGETNPARNGDGFDRTRLNRMTDDVLSLALAAYLTGDERFAEHAERQIRVWFVDEKTRMNPNLAYAQSIPGRTDGRAIGIIDSRLFQEVVDAAALMARTNALDAEVEAGLRQWIGAYAAWLIQSENGQEERGKENNHGTFYDSQLAHFLVYAGRCDLALRVIEDSKARTVSQIKPNGIMPHEAKRTRSLHYHAFNAEAFLRLSQMAQALGTDLYDYEVGASGSVRDTVHKIAAYNGRLRSWPYPRLDDRGGETVALALRRSLLIDPSDETVRGALRRADETDEDDPLRLYTFGL